MKNLDDMIDMSKEEIYAYVERTHVDPLADFIKTITPFVQSTNEHKKVTDETIALILEHVGNLEKRISTLEPTQ